MWMLKKEMTLIPIAAIPAMGIRVIVLGLLSALSAVWIRVRVPDFI